MSSSEDYLDSLLDSILGGGEFDGDEKPAAEGGQETSAENRTVTDAGKAMSPDEIEEMLVSMGTLDGGEEGRQEPNSEGLDMEVTPAFTDDHNAGITGGTQTDDLIFDDLTSEQFGMENGGSSGDVDINQDGLSLDELDMGEGGLAEESASEEDMDLKLDDLSLGDLDMEEGEPPEESVSEEDMDLNLNDFSLDDLDMGEGGLAEESVSEEDTDLNSDDLSLGDLDMEEARLTEESVSDENMDLNLNDFSLDDLDMGEEEMPEESASEEAADLKPDDLSLGDLDMGEGGLAGESVSEEDTDLNSDDLSLGDLDMEEAGLQEESVSEEDMDLNLNDFSLDDLDMGEEGVPEESVSEEDTDLKLDAFSLDDLDLGEAGLPEESVSDEDMDLKLDAFSLDDLDLGEAGLPEESVTDEDAEFNLDDLSLDDLDMGEGESSEGGMDSFSLDDLSLEEEMSDDTDDLMSEEEIDRLLGGGMSFDDESETAEHFALEESGEDDELSALLAGMDHDEDLSEINDLLEESQQGVSADDDMLAMLEGVDGDAGFDLFSGEANREAESMPALTPEELAADEGTKKEKEKKKRKKLFGKKKGDDEELPVKEMGSELEDLLGEVSVQESGGEKPEEKKQGAIARFLDFLLEADEEEDPVAAEVLAGNGGATGNISGENRELLDELNEEDKKGKKKKKGKKEKKKEEAPKEKKPKKVKEKKKKEKAADSDVDLFAPPEKRLSKKKVIVVFLFCGTIAACIILGTSILPNYVQEREARIAYDQKEYREVFDLLYGKDLKEQDELLLKKSSLVLQLDRKLSSYGNYMSLNMRLEALDALISGVERYHHILPEAESYNVVNEVSDIYVQILGRLSSDFGVSEADALDIIGSVDDETYSLRLMAIINGTYSSDADMSDVRQDVLFEEEEIIERIDGLEEELTDVLPEEEMPDEELQDDSQPDEDMQDMLPEEEPAADENSDEGSEV